MAKQKRNLFSMMERAYGAALLDLATEAGNVDEVRAEVMVLHDHFLAEPGLHKLAQSRVLGVERRAGSIERIFRGRVSDLLYRFLLVLNRRNRFDEFPQIAEAFEALVEERFGEVHAEAVVAAPMDEGTLTQIAQRLGKAIKRTIILDQRIDPAVIGGLKLRIGDEVVDGSVATQLRKLEEQLVEAGRENARKAAV